MYKRIIKKHDFKTILFFTGYKGGGNCCTAIYRIIQDKRKDKRLLSTVVPLKEAAGVLQNFGLSSEGKQIRKIILEGEWYFSVVDVVAVLTDSSDPKDYWYRIKKREKIEGIELSTICR